MQNRKAIITLADELVIPAGGELEIKVHQSRKENVAIGQGRWVYIGAQGDGGFTGSKPGDHALGGPAALQFTGRVNSDIELCHFKSDPQVAPPCSQTYRENVN